MSTLPILGFSPYNAEEPLQGMDLQEKDEKHTGKLIRKTPYITSAY